MGEGGNGAVCRTKKRAALILTGGGVTAASFEIGCLAAFDTVFGPGFCARFFDIYIGASAGSIIAALAAGGISPQALRTAIRNDREVAYNFQRRDIYRVELRRVLAHLWRVTRGTVDAFREYRRQGWEFSFADIFFIVQELLPPGIFSLTPLQSYMADVFRRESIPDDFSAIEHELYIPAIDLDRAERVVFGAPGHRDTRISDAIAASCAIPAFFRPYRIGDRYYVDGGFGGLCHLDVAIARGAEVVLMINPIVPAYCDPERVSLPRLSHGHARSITELGISFVGDQSLRIQGRERLDLALAACRAAHPEIDVMLLEPSREDTLLFLNGPMSFEARRRILEAGYELTLRNIESHPEVFHRLFEAPQPTPVVVSSSDDLVA